MSTSASSPSPSAASDHPASFATPIAAVHHTRRHGLYHEHFSVELSTPTGAITLDTLPKSLATHRKFAAFVLSRVGLALQPVPPRDWQGVLARILQRGRAVTSA